MHEYPVPEPRPRTPTEEETFDLPSPPLFQSYRLFTDGKYPEIDAMAICGKTLDDLEDPDAASRVASWLSQRFGGGL